MKISLRKAHALQKQIEETIVRLSLSDRYSYGIVIDEFTEDVEKYISDKRTEFLKSIDDKEVLINLLYSIRKSISEKGSETQIDEYLNIVAKLDRKIKFYTECSSIPEATDSIATTKQRLEKIIERNNASTNSSSSSIMVKPMTKEDIEAFKQKVIFFKKEKQNYQDKLLELNMSTQIELSDSDQETLKMFNLL